MNCIKKWSQKKKKIEARLQKNIYLQCLLCLTMIVLYTSTFTCFAQNSEHSSYIINSNIIIVLSPGLVVFN